MGKAYTFRSRLGIFFIFLAGLMLAGPAFSLAADTVCARVKIEIKQELTLERQAFDAHMRITNGLSGITLDNVGVTVSFADADGNIVPASSDPDNTDALFFIRLDSMENISDVSGTGTVEPTSTADIHWLIIPAPGASDGLEKGKLYYVGAKLTYTLGGDQKITEVTPDYIFVKPMPELTLDYFLPSDVYGDDPDTTEIEPVIPFSLGVRVKNSGFGMARNLKIDSAQPKITENKQGLLIGFAIEGSEVNGQPATESLLVNFGDISPNRAATACWIMTCTLSGKFVFFGAEFSHADELGGAVTSLIQAANTHFLVRDVVVDLPGRDAIVDFLALDGDVYRVYESEAVETEVVDQSNYAGLQMIGNTGRLTAPLTAGLMYVQLPDPFGGQKVLKEVVRSDGKLIKSANAWLSKMRDKDSVWHYFINIFDVNTTDQYTLEFDEAASVAQPPELSYIPDRTVVEGGRLSFIVDATDPNGTFPALAAAPLPAGATLVDQGDGTAVFEWTPADGQAGSYEIAYTASDGVLEAVRRAVITVTSASDTDGDGLPDDWEREHFGDLNADGLGDADGDGLTNYQEFMAGTDPMESNAPDVPKILVPVDGSEVAILSPQMIIENSTDPDNDPVTYIFELYSDAAMKMRVDSISNLPAGTTQTAWAASGNLKDNAHYYWRVRATDSYGFSTWAYGSFFVNTANDPPEVCRISRPQPDTQVDRLMPVLEVINSTDVDEDELTYGFAVYAAGNPDIPLVTVSGLATGAGGSTPWTVSQPLADNTIYLWTAIVTDEHGAEARTQLSSFSINTANDAPGAPGIIAPQLGEEVAASQLNLTIGNAVDQDGDILTYIFELDTVNTFDSPALTTSGSIDEGSSSTQWPVGGLLEDTVYYWRAKANDGAADGPWAAGRFFVNTANQPPTVPGLKNPGDLAWVPTPTPTLEIHPATDSDGDLITYRFELGLDAGLSDPLYIQDTVDLQWTLASALSESTRYYWHVQAIDEHGAQSGWTLPVSFFVNSNGIDDPPSIILTQPAVGLVTNAPQIELVWQDDDPDSNALIDLFVDTDGAGQDGSLLAGGIFEDPEGQADRYFWDAGSLADGTYHVYAVISDDLNSAASYAPGAVTIDRSPPVVSMNPAGGTYSNFVVVTAAADEPAALYCTEDGSTPTTASPKYTQPIELTDSVTINCLAIDAAGNSSAVFSQTYTIAIAVNVPPIADAGTDLSVSLDETAYLDGSASSDPDGGPGALTVSWQFVSLPAGSGLSQTDIYDAQTFYPYFQPDVTGDFVLELTLHDGADAVSDQVIISCTAAMTGDLDGDDDVDIEDYNIFRTAYGACAADANYLPGADLDQDGCVTINDYRTLRSLM
jgi:hypothetical protein